MRNTRREAWKRYRRERWQIWLSSRQPDVPATRLASELADRGTHKDSQPRNMVYAWMRGNRTPQADTAWETGQALHRLWYRESGPLALYAAGCYSELIGLLARLASVDDVDAAKLACLIPVAVDISIAAVHARSMGKAVVQALKPYNEDSKSALTLCGGIADSVDSLLKQAWGTKKTYRRAPLPKDADPDIRWAYSVCLVPGVHPGETANRAWEDVVTWARRIIMRTSGVDVQAWDEVQNLWQRYKDWRKTAIEKFWTHRAMYPQHPRPRELREALRKALHDGALREERHFADLDLAAKLRSRKKGGTP